MLNDTEEFVCFAALEKRLSSKLLHRSTRHIHLTDAGHKIQADAEKLLDQIQALQMQSRNINTELSGKFVITAPVSMATYLLAPELDALKQAFPHMDFVIRSANRIVDLVSEEVDLGIRTDSVVNDNLIARQLGFMREIFVASNQFYEPQSFGHISELSVKKLLVNPHYIRNGRLNFCCGEETSNLSIQGATLIQDNPISVEMLFQNDYVGWLPDYCRHLSRQGHQLINVLPEYCGVEWPVFLVYPFQVPLPLKLQKVAGFLQERLSARLINI